jgi:Arc/MetJ family transcription regulator
MKHLVDIDDELLCEAMNYLHTSTIKATVDQALRLAADKRREELQEAWKQFGELAKEIPLADRAEAW